VPCDFAALTAFAGVGPKCANLVLGIACNDPHGVAVDVHVHRVTNRWGYVAATTPEKTMAALERVLPRLVLGWRSTSCWCRSEVRLHGQGPEVLDVPVLEICRQGGG
jgi:endonuclease-3